MLIADVGNGDNARQTIANHCTSRQWMTLTPLVDLLALKPEDTIELHPHEVSTIFNRLGLKLYKLLSLFPRQAILALELIASNRKGLNDPPTSGFSVANQYPVR